MGNCKNRGEREKEWLGENEERKIVCQIWIDETNINFIWHFNRM